MILLIWLALRSCFLKDGEVNCDVLLYLLDYAFRGTLGFSTRCRHEYLGIRSFAVGGRGTELCHSS